MVDLLTHNPKLECLNPTTDTERANIGTNIDLTTADNTKRLINDFMKCKC